MIIPSIRFTHFISNLLFFPTIRAATHCDKQDSVNQHAEEQRTENQVITGTRQKKSSTVVATLAQTQDSGDSRHPLLAEKPSSWVSHAFIPWVPAMSRKNTVIPPVAQPNRQAHHMAAKHAHSLDEPSTSSPVSPQRNAPSFPTRPSQQTVFSPLAAPKDAKVSPPAVDVDVHMSEETPTHKKDDPGSAAGSSNSKGLWNGGARSLTTESLPSSSSSSRAVAEPEVSTLSSDSDDDEVPLSKKRRKRQYTELVCPRPSCRKRFDHVVNLNNHVGRQLCPDLKAAKGKKESRKKESRKTQEPQPIKEPIRYKHWRISNGSSSTTFADDLSAEMRQDIQPETGVSGPSPSKSSRSIASYFSPIKDRSLAPRHLANQSTTTAKNHVPDVSSASEVQASVLPSRPKQGIPAVLGTCHGQLLASSL